MGGSSAREWADGRASRPACVARVENALPVVMPCPPRSDPVYPVPPALRGLGVRSVPGTGATGHGEEVRAHPQHARLTLDAGDGVEQLLPAPLVLPARLKLGHQPA